MSKLRDKPKTTRFRPLSKRHFSCYVDNLSWLTKQPYQRTMEMLARVYGYANYHELQQDLAKGWQLAGPFDDEEAYGTIASGSISDHLLDISGRRNRVLRFVAEYKGLSVDTLSPLYREAANLGLFKTLARHREDFRRIRDRLNTNDLIKNK